jgi:predicted Na+-dependent transporter
MRILKVMTMNKRHALIMLACCLIPLVALGAIFIFKVPVNNVLYFGLVLLCPVLHLLMMGSMLKHDHNEHQAQHHEVAQPQMSQLSEGEKQG